MAKLSVGLMHQLWAMTSTTDAEFYRDTISEIALADQLGFDSVWLAEHHLVRSGAFYARLPDPEILIARLIPETERIRLGTGIKILATDSALRTAERMRLLALLAGFRVVFGVGLGNPKELDFLDLPDGRRRSLFRERLVELVGYLGSSGEVNGRALSPLVDLEIPCFLYAGARDPESLAVAAHLGVSFVTGESDTVLAQGDQVATYRGAGGRGRCRGARLIAVAETTCDAWRIAEPAIRSLYRARRQHGEPVGELTGDLSVDESLEQMAGDVHYVVGDPGAVAESLSSYLSGTGCDELNVMVHGPGIDHDAVCRMLELVAQEVLPRLQAARAPA